MSYCKNKFCEVCDRDRATFCSSLSMYLCDKHMGQFYRYGKILDNNSRTINDLNEINIIGNIAYMNIYNSRNEHIYTTIFDAEDVEKVKTHKWRSTTKRGKPYIVSGHGAGNQIYLARYVLNYDGKLEVAHIDGNVLNNCKSNLRCVPHSDNAKNIKPKSNNQLGIRGISMNSKKQMYSVDFSYEKKRYYVKSWKNFEDAVLCRYYLETLINPLRYTGNDEKILQIIKDIPQAKKQEIYNYVFNKIKENNAD